MIRLVCLDRGQWVSDDFVDDPDDPRARPYLSRVLITLDDTFETECDEPHPVKIRVDDPNASYMVSEARKSGATVHTKQGRTKAGWVNYYTWQCPGSCPHFYSQWTVSIDGDWTDDVYDTFSEARGVVEAIVGKTVLVRRKPEPVVPASPSECPSCGNRWEFDINGGCYHCHHSTKATVARYELLVGKGA